MNYHEEMDSTYFEKYVSKVMDKTEKCCYYDENESYYSQNPEHSLEKSEIQWLKRRNITYTEDTLKIELMKIVKQHYILHRLSQCL